MTRRNEATPCAADVSATQRHASRCRMRRKCRNGQILPADWRSPSQSMMPILKALTTAWVRWDTSSFSKMM